MLAPLVFLLFYSFLLFSVTSLEEALPKSNLYVFGDSNFETGGKSSGHDSWMKAGYLPYGISCMFIGQSRFTDGKTIPELIVDSLNLNAVSSIDQLRLNPERGANFASASAGILQETGTAFGKNLCFKEQIKVFKEYVQKDLKGRYKTEKELSKYLSKSIFFINFGASDYIHNYLQPNYYNTSNHYNGEEFANLLIEKYGDYLKDLHKLGARKMTIFQIGPLGCFPYMIKKLKPRSRCAENINDLISTFNKKLDVKLKELQNEFKDSKLVTAQVFPLIKNMIENPGQYGFEETRWPCCPVDKNGTGLCKETVFREVSPSELNRLSGSREEETWEAQTKLYCENIPMPESLKRSKKWTGPNEDVTCVYRWVYVFFDELHLTQAANKVIVDRCLTDTSGTCSPLGMNQLIKE